MKSGLSLHQIITDYRNTAEHNDSLFELFTQLTRQNALLHEHRSHIETNTLGFGDPAHHFLWHLLIDNLPDAPTPTLLEIGVYKGQVISLWCLLLREMHKSAGVYAISPLRGGPRPKRLKRLFSALVSKKFRERLQNGDFYEDLDYRAVIASLFERFRLSPNSVSFIEGYSSDPVVREAVAEQLFDLVYVDGDHTYEGAKADFDFYGRRVKRGGFLVADDANCGIPGSLFWKGHPAVSRAVTALDEQGFKNVLNVGHMRVMERYAL